MPRLAVNVSGRQLWGGFDGDFVRRVLDKTGFPADRLVFEITESLLIDEDRRVGSILRDFRDLGIGIALDDFGTGYSALGNLRHFPVTMLKIDRTFVGDIATNSSDAHLVEAVIALGHALQLTVVAEGVETPAQAQILRNLGCELAQGYLFARPMPGSEFAQKYFAATPGVLSPASGARRSARASPARRRAQLKPNSAVGNVMAFTSLT